jgi:hypothetical protein
MHRVYFFVFAASACVGCSGSGSNVGGDGSTPESATPEDHSEVDHSVPMDTGAGDTTPPVDAGADCGIKDGGNSDGPITITPCPYEIYPPDAKVCTGFSMMAASFELYDNTDASIDLVNVNESCSPVPYGMATPSTPLSVTTYTFSAWQLQDHTTKAPIGSFVLEADQSYSVTVK